MIHDIQPKMGAIAGTTTLRKELIDKTLAYLERLAADGAGHPELMRELVTSYLELAKIQGMPQDANLGDAAAAHRALERALRLTEALLLEDANDPATLEVAALCYRQSAFALQSQNRQRAAEHAQRALELSEKLAGLKPADTRARGTLADALLAAAIIQGSLPKYQQALALYRSLPLPDSNPAVLRNTALIHKYLSGWYLSADELPKRDPHKALQHALSAAEIDEKLLAANPDHPQSQLDLAIDLSQVSSSYRVLGDLPKAFSAMRRSVAIREQVVRQNPDDVRAQDRLAYGLSHQASYREQLGDSRGALADFRRAVVIYDRLYARKAVNNQMLSQYAYCHYRIGSLLQQDGKAAEACTHHLRSTALYAEREKMGKFFDSDLDNLGPARAAAAACAAR